MGDAGDGAARLALRVAPDFNNKIYGGPNLTLRDAVGRLTDQVFKSIERIQW
jgi:hypothetical protein